MGHSTSLWNPRNSRYIFGIREGIHIISLETIAAHLRRACRVTEAVAESGGLILFVGTRQGQDRCVVEAAKRAKGCHLFDRWVPGSLTNGQQLLGQCKMVVVDELDRELPEYADGLVNQSVIKPDLVVCLNPLENEVLLHECGLHNVPTIGVIDTDANPTWVTYPIPANDDSIRCIEMIAGVLGRAGEEGQRKRLALAEKGVLLYKRVDLEKVDENHDLDDSGSAAAGTGATGDKSAAADDEDDEELEDEEDEDVDEEEEEDEDSEEEEEEDDNEGFGERDLEEDSEGGKDRRDDPTPVLTRRT
jgi:small subunit ribosomal protein S2